MATPRRVAANTLAVAGVIGGLYVLWLVRDVLGLLGLAVFVAVALAPLVRAYERLGAPRIVAILASYASLVGALFVIGLVVVPPIVEEIETFVDRAPGYVQDIRDSDTLREYDERYGIVAKLESQAEKLPGTLADGFGELESVTVGIFRRVVELVAVLVMAAFLLLDGPRGLNAALRMLGPERERRAHAVARDIARAVGGYVVGSFTISLIAGLVAFGLMTLLGIPFAVPLAVLAALFALVPIVGSMVTAVAIGLVAVFEDFPTTVILWLVLFTTYQQIESHLLGPFVYRRTVKLHPLLAIVAVLAGASLLGVLGALLAVPVAATIQIVALEWWRARVEAAGAQEGPEQPGGGRGEPAPA